MQHTVFIDGKACRRRPPYHLRDFKCACRRAYARNNVLSLIYSESYTKYWSDPAVRAFVLKFVRDIAPNHEYDENSPQTMYLYIAACQLAFQRYLRGSKGYWTAVEHIKEFIPDIDERENYILYLAIFELYMAGRPKEEPIESLFEYTDALFKKAPTNKEAFSVVYEDFRKKFEEQPFKRSSFPF